MRPGDTLRLRGSGGAPFVVTVGVAFTEADIKKRLASGEWSRLDDAPAQEKPVQDTPQRKAEAPSAPASKVDPDRPAVNASKADWIAYVARTQHMSREDAANYTKADLIDMAS